MSGAFSDVPGPSLGQTRGPSLRVTHVTAGPEVRMWAGPSATFPVPPRGRQGARAHVSHVVMHLLCGTTCEQLQRGPFSALVTSTPKVSGRTSADQTEVTWDSQGVAAQPGPCRLLWKPLGDGATTPWAGQGRQTLGGEGNRGKSNHPCLPGGRGRRPDSEARALGPGEGARAGRRRDHGAAVAQAGGWGRTGGCPAGGRHPSSHAQKSLGTPRSFRFRGRRAPLLSGARTGFPPLSFQPCAPSTASVLQRARHRASLGANLRLLLQFH